MSLFHLVIVAIIQGLTEFLPVSSSGHLILLPELSDMPDQGQIIDVAVHVGTLFAVMAYFHRDVAMMIGGLPQLLRGRLESPGARLVALLAISTVPVMAFGVFLKLTGINDHLRSISVIGWTMLVFGVVLYYCDQYGAQEKQTEDWSWRDAWIFGLFQAIALIPGTSRSGITISGARIMGYERREAARLSMLMSIPAIIASGVFLASEAVIGPDPGVLRDGAIAAGLAFGTALLALTLMMRLLRSVSFTPYVIYRVFLGVVLLWIAYS